MNRISEKYRSRTEQKNKEITKKTLAIDDVFKFIDFKIERNNIQIKAMINIGIAILVWLPIARLSADSIVAKIFIFSGLILYLYLMIDALMNIRKAMEMDIVLGRLKMGPKSNQDTNGKLSNES